MFRRASATDRARQERLDASDDVVWFHSIDLGFDVVTDGHKTQAMLEAEFARMDLRSLAGKTVLDVGAWDGYFSFEAEKLGAHVVALDHYAWALDIHEVQRYTQACAEAGETPKAFDQVPSVWRPDSLPGRAGFDIAHRYRNSSVEPRYGDLMSTDLDIIGVHDIVFYLGVLYHVHDPFLALRNLRKVTRELAVIETVCGVVPGCEHHALWEFFETTELNGDPTNWWAPNVKALLAACRAAGFSDVRALAHPSADAPPVGHEWHYGRAVIQARP